MTPRLFVRPAGPRPDFRVVITFLWSEMHNVDSEGNSHNPASREWTWLYLRDRAEPKKLVEVHQVQEDPLVLAIDSDQAALAARVAFFLARETGGEVAFGTGVFTSADSLLPLLGADFDLTEALQRADDSVWRSATEDNPYPNLSTTFPLRMYSAGDCAVCASAGAAIFLIGEPEGIIFFACAECGCAWAQPPGPLVVDTVDPPIAFAPSGFRLASFADIDAAGLARLIRDDHAERSSSGFAGTPGFRRT